MLDRINAAMREGDFATALATARELVAAEPANADAWHLLGIAAMATGESAAAREALDRAVGLDPEQAAFHATRAALDMTEGKPTDGLREALSLNPNTLSAYILQVHAALARGDLPEARRRLRLAQRVDAGHPQVSMAEGYVADASGDRDLALRCFTAAATARPNMASAQLALGLAYLQRQTWAFAEQALSNALRLDPSRPRIALRGLVEAQRRQDDRAGALTSLDELVERFPAELDAIVLRADLRLQSGDRDGAIADLEHVLARQPRYIAALRRMALLLAGDGRAPDARALIDKALADAPADRDTWQLRMNLCGPLGESPVDVLQQWHAADPGSADCMELMADFHRSRGDIAQAAAWAERALAVDGNLFHSNMIMLEVEQARDLDLALVRADRLLVQQTDVQRQRQVLAWAGLALDQAGRHAEATLCWKNMLQRVSRQSPLVPPPSVAPADQVPEGTIEATLVWAPVGVRGEAVLMAAKQQLGNRLDLGRASVVAAGDGFGLVRFPPGDPRAGSAERWAQAVTAAGLDPATLVDWMPHLDPYTLAALRGARVLCLLADPRDALLNWFVFGSLQNYLPSPDPVAAADWLARTLDAVADHRDAHPDRVVFARLDGDAAEAAAAIEQALGLPQPLPGLHGRGARLPSGHWRHYREGFAEAFERLAPVAARLGYPAA